MRYALHSTITALALAAVPCMGQVVTPTGDSVPAAQAADVESIDAIIVALYDVISGPAGEAQGERGQDFQGCSLHDRSSFLIKPGCDLERAQTAAVNHRQLLQRG